jgi:hypothetical protein
MALIVSKQIKPSHIMEKSKSNVEGVEFYNGPT